VKTPRISILMAVRNEQKHLGAALASLQRQSLRDWELVVVDDGSQDETAGILASAARHDERIRVLTRPARGLVPALNEGLAACGAKLVARMDGDDISHPQRLTRQAAYLEAHPHIDLVASAVCHFPRPLVSGGMCAYETWQNGLLEHAQIVRDLFVESPFAHPSVAFRRAAVMAAGGYHDREWAEDYDLWLRLAHRGCRFARIAKRLLFWRERPERLTRTAANCSADAFRACKVHHLKNGFLRGHERVTLWGAGIEGKAWRRALADQQIIVNRWAEVDRRKIGQIIHHAPVVPIEALQPGTGPILVTVGAKGARSQVRAWAAQRGLIEGQDFLCVT